MLRKLLVGLALAFLPGLALAAVAVNSIVTPQTPKDGLVQFLQGTDSAGTYKTLYTGNTTGNAAGSVCRAVVETNNDASATHLITIQVVNGGVKYGGTAFTTVSSDGFANATPPKNVMDPTIWPGLPRDSDGNPFLFLANGDTLQATFATALTSTDLINLYAVCADY